MVGEKADFTQAQTADLSSETEARVDTQADAAQPDETETVLDTQQEDQPLRVKKKWKKFLWITVPAVVVAAAILFNLGWIRAFCIRSFGSAQDYLQYVEANSKNSTANALTGLYGNLRNAFDMSDQSVNTQFSVEVGENFSGLFSSATGEEMDFSWLENMIFAQNVTLRDDVYNVKMGIGVDGEALVSADLIADIPNNRLLFAVPELNASYIAFNGVDLNVDMEKVFNNFKMISSVLPDEKTFEKLLEKYLEVIVQNIGDVEQHKDTLTIGDISQNCTVLTCEITKDDVFRMVKAVLETARVDEDIKELIEGLQNVVSESGQVDSENLYELFVEYIDHALTEMQESEELQSEDTDAMETIEITNYINGRDVIIGRTLRVMGTEIFSYGMVEKGDQFEFMGEIGANTDEAVSISGSGTVKSDTYSGDCNLKVGGSSYFEMDFENYNAKLAANGMLSGIFRVRLGNALYEEMGSEAASVIRLLNPALEIDCGGDQDKSNLSVRFLTNDELLIGLTAQTETGKPGSVSIPETAIDGNNVTEMASWAEQIDVEGFCAKLRGAGIPDELVDQIKAAFGTDSVFESDYGTDDYDYDYGYDYGTDDYDYGYDYGTDDYDYDYGYDYGTDDYDYDYGYDYGTDDYDYGYGYDYGTDDYGYGYENATTPLI